MVVYVNFSQDNLPLTIRRERAYRLPGWPEPFSSYVDEHLCDGEGRGGVHVHPTLSTVTYLTAVG